MYNTGTTISTPAITFMDTSPESCDHLRQAIDDEINSLEESIRALKSRQNELAPISRLPPETLAAIFLFFSLSTWRGETGWYEWHNEPGNIAWICVAHVCRLWREIALNYPRFWSHINLTKLTPVGMAEMLSRAKKLPLYMEADTTKWSAERIVAFGKQLETHISHTRHLRISGGYLPTLLKQLVSSAPILEFLSLSTKSLQYSSLESPQATIPDNLFNRTTPSLTNLELESCNIIWMSPLLKGLRSLQILKLSSEARPKLEDWLDALDEMPQLEELSLQSATPLAPLTDPFISEHSHSAALPSLIRFYISDSPKECALAIAHLILPALTRLHVVVQSYDREGEDVRLVIPYITRNVRGIHVVEPLRSILFSGEEKRAEVLAWTMPDADVKVHNSTTLLSESASARLMFTATGPWSQDVVTATYDALFAHLPVNSVSTFSVLNRTRLSKEFWLNQTRRLPLLEQVRLVSTAVKAFRDMLAEDTPPNRPRLPLLTKLTILHVAWTLKKTYHFRDMLLKRVEQGVPLESLDLVACEEPKPPRVMQVFGEIVVDVQKPLSSSWRKDEWGVRTGSSKEVEYDPKLVEYDDDWYPEPWYGLDDDEEEYVWDDYVGPFDGIDLDNIQVELDPEDGLPYGW